MSNTQRLHFILSFAFAINILCIAISATYFSLTHPVSLPKVLSLKPKTDTLEMYHQGFESMDERDIYNFIGSVPYKENASNSWQVDPKRKYQDTILNGNGNCANLAFGAMYAFNDRMQQAAIVHLLSADLRFLTGYGHTVLSINLGGENAVVDIAQAGMHLQNQHNIDIKKYTLSSTDVFEYMGLSDRRAQYFPYFTHDYLSQIEFGVIPQEEIMAYFDFIESFYVPFGSAFVEKLFYDTLALMFGRYPNTYVNERFFWAAYKKSPLRVFFAYLFLVSFHLSYVFFLILFFLRAFNILKEQHA